MAGLRSEGSWTSHNGSSVNFLGDGTIFWGDGTKMLGCAILAVRFSTSAVSNMDPNLLFLLIDLLLLIGAWKKWLVEQVRG